MRTQLCFVQVILEVCLLTAEEITDACVLAALAGASFVKTSTGFSTGGATADSVRLMKAAVGDRLQVKAAGGVRTLEDARQYTALGVTRIGTSSGPALVAGAASSGY